MVSIEEFDDYLTPTRMSNKSYAQRETERMADFVELRKISLSGSGDYKNLTKHRNLLAALHKAGIQTKESKSDTMARISVKQHHMLRAKIISNSIK